MSYGRRSYEETRAAVLREHVALFGCEPLPDEVDGMVRKRQDDDERWAREFEARRRR